MAPLPTDSERRTMDPPRAREILSLNIRSSIHTRARTRAIAVRTPPRCPCEQPNASPKRSRAPMARDGVLACRPRRGGRKSQRSAPRGTRFSASLLPRASWPPLPGPTPCPSKTPRVGPPQNQPSRRPPRTGRTPRTPNAHRASGERARTREACSPGRCVPSPHAYYRVRVRTRGTASHPVPACESSRAR